MSIYYILAPDGSVFELDATTGMTYSEASSITTHKMEDGSVVADHVVNEPVRISFDGVITDVKLITTDRSKDTGTFIDGMKALKDSKQLFTTIWREDAGDSGSSNIYRVKNCLFRSLSLSQDQELGYSSGKHAYRVSMEIEQIRIAQRAAIRVDKTFAIEIVDKVTPKEDPTGGTTDGLDPNSPKSSRIFSTIIKASMPAALQNILNGGF